MIRGSWLLIGTIVCASSFFGTLWILKELEVKGGFEMAATLENASISDNASLETAAKAAGFEPSPNIHGVVDVLTRLSNDQVKIKGWAADLGSDGSPIDVFGFSQGKVLFQAQTYGERPDVIAFFKLAPDAPAMRNVIFDVTTSCHAGEKIIIAAFARSKEYGPMASSQICP